MTTDRPVELGAGLRDYLAGDTIRDEDYGGLQLDGRRLVAKDPIRIAVIGCGNHSRGALQPGLARLPHFDYVAACDLEEALAADCARRYGGGAVFTDYRRMLDEVTPEAVLVVGPPQLHLEAGLEAAARGIHLFVEKPSAPDLSGAEALADAFRNAGRIGMVGFFWRHSEAFQRAARLAADPEFGTTLLFDGLYLSPGPRLPLWGAMDAAYSFLTDQAIHAVDAMRFLMGDVEEVAARVGEGPGGAFGYAVTLRFASGAAGSLAVTSFTNAFSSRFTMHGSAGAALEIIDAEVLRLVARPALPGGRGGYVDQNLAPVASGLELRRPPPAGLHGGARRLRPRDPRWIPAIREPRRRRCGAAGVRRDPGERTDRPQRCSDGRHAGGAHRGHGLSRIVGMTASGPP